MYSEMFIFNKKTGLLSPDASLRNMLRSIIEDNDIPLSSIASQLKIDKRSLEKYLDEGIDLRFGQAIAIMQFLNIDESDFIKAYKNDLAKEDDEAIENAKRLSFIYSQFDIPTLKEIGIVKKRSKIEELEEQICSFFDFKSSIYEYETFSILPSLFSKSRRNITEERANKMTKFWLKCSIYSFKAIDNPNDYNKELLIEFMKRIHEYTIDKEYGYEKVVLILFRLGITVLTQSYMSRTGSFGVTMLVNDKPCIIITDMNKKYHKLWLSLLHELYHVINDFDILQSYNCHISSEQSPDILFNEQKADTFAKNVLIPIDIQSKLGTVVKFPIKMRMLAEQIEVDSSIIYGVYLDNLPKELQSTEYGKYGGREYLISSDIAIKNIQFDSISVQSLSKAIDKIKGIIYNKQII